MFGYANGGWEYPAYLTLLAFVQGLLGDGKFALIRSLSFDRMMVVGQARMQS